ncbi:MAG: D-alanyl-D-alanine carboxypeptidase/D-alanyl-D-alanine-endopeptidase [Bacteroidetes bacterium]|nr:D-alanyl-D-alanine carboxypeptidase/D-alanyl-D-alanine-endopeptidase [Bacteroidota bacterium]
MRSFLKEEISNRQRIKIFFFALFIFSFFPSFAQKHKEKEKKTTLFDEIELLKKDDDFKHVTWGICVVKTDNDSTIAEYNSEVSMIPASTMKVITTAPALSLLGKDFRFKTLIQYTGNIDKTGTLHGNIYIKGGGDPTLGAYRFDKTTTVDYILKQWMDGIFQAGINKIDGAIIGDASIFEDELIAPNWLYADIGNYYGAGACGLDICENAFTVYFEPSKNEGDSAKIVRIDPDVPNMEVINKVTVSGPSKEGTGVYINGTPYSNLRIFEGKIPLNKKEEFEIYGSQPDPSLTCTYLFDKFLKSECVEISQKPTTIRLLKMKNQLVDTLKRKTIFTTNSPTLEEIVYQTNLRSLNVYAEHLLKMMGYIVNNEGGTYSGIKAVRNFWSSRGVDLSGFLMEDGSGLSPMNNVTPRHLTEMLRVFTKDATFTSFYNSLPIGGKTGSISNILKGSAADNNLRAKSGYMYGVRSFTGYVKNKKKEQLAFSIIINNYECKAAEIKKKFEKLMIKIAELD